MPSELLSNLCDVMEVQAGRATYCSEEFDICGEHTQELRVGPRTIRRLGSVGLDVCRGGGGCLGNILILVVHLQLTLKGCMGDSKGGEAPVACPV